MDATLTELKQCHGDTCSRVVALEASQKVCCSAVAYDPTVKDVCMWSVSLGLLCFEADERKAPNGLIYSASCAVLKVLPCFCKSMGRL